MRDTFTPKLLDREVSSSISKAKAYRSLYSDRRLISELDIVNELNGHSGCVNALSWSKSGNLLASGSDDQHLNIHSHQQHGSDKQFQLHTTVATGHTQNIFSVKFMPHSNDQTVITCAGDGEVRVFDLEYSGQSVDASAASSMASAGRGRGRNTVYDGVRQLSDGDTDCRVYRSHADRAKRIVTESSPFLFLTCSEDGEVRQWDLRQPSSAYPSPRGGRLGTVSDTSVPPPLISYKRYNLDLNTISCSASQPHYIALGGAHLHCFLHDRRMIGRDRLREAGKPSSSSPRTNEDEELMAQATRCVRKFAPQGQKKMRRSDNGHITACKISDARPDEMLVSWSGDHIYSFDLVRSPDVTTPEKAAPPPDGQSARVKESKERNRKRKANGSETSPANDATARASSRPRTGDTDANGEETALRIRYQNGQQEEIPLSVRPATEQVRLNGAGPYLTAKQKNASRIAKATVKIRASLFGVADEERAETARFTETLGHATSILSDIDQAMRDWTYPMDPSQHQVLVQQTLRRNRESVWRFVQAAGTLARVLGGRLQTPSGTSPMMAQFASIATRSNDIPPATGEKFGYDFLKAIVLWLDSGLGSLVEGFTRPADMTPVSKVAERLPIPESEATTEAVDDFLIPYLLRHASDKPVVNPGTNRFEVDENRRLFPSEKAAVLAFAAAVRIPFADLSSAVMLVEGQERIQAQDRATAATYWAFKVARGVLLNAAEGAGYSYVDRAFGGLGRVIRSVETEEAGLEQVSDGEEEPVEEFKVVRKTAGGGPSAEQETLAPEELLDEPLGAQVTGRIGSDDAARNALEAIPLFNDTTKTGPDDGEEDDEGEEDEDEDEEEDEDEDAGELDVDSVDEHDEGEESSEPDEEDGVPNSGFPRFMYQSAFERRSMREKVELDVPCSAHTRMYRGHCNVKTVKDVNYFGLEDEYVVSGSDDGNLFIWDRKTSELVNVLEGDGEVVNVVQGHPYEPMLAVSGIDHTIKIFSPDGRARQAARLGRDVSAHDPAAFSSLAWPSRIGRRRLSRRNAGDAHDGATSEPAMPAGPEPAEDENDEEEELVAPAGLSSRRRMHDAYRIMNQNDVERQGGNQDAFITRSMLHQLATRIRAQRAGPGGNPNIVMGEGAEVEGDDEGRVRLVLGDDCVAM